MSARVSSLGAATLLLMLCSSLVHAQQAQSAEEGLPAVETVGGVSLPAVPGTVAVAAVEAGANARQSVEAAQESAPPLNVTADSNITLEVLPGTTELVRIARNYLNRLITPFEDPKLLTVNPVEVRKEGSSIYLTTSSEKPVGVHILPNDPEDTRSISLTLIPARIPPKTIQLKWGEHKAASAIPISSARAKRWEQSSAYEEKLLELAEIVARGEVPEGYSLSEAPESLSCALPGVQFFVGQRLTGSRFSVFVLRATNVGRSTIEILSHAGCSFPGVALVAPWPQAYLEPNASTEIYVAVVNEAFEPQPRGQLRPSLLERSR